MILEFKEAARLADDKNLLDRGLPGSCGTDLGMFANDLEVSN